nr:hypothetical protein [Haloterrigena salifodinae]
MFVVYIGAGFVGLYALAVFGQGGIEDPNNAMPLLMLEFYPARLRGGDQPSGRTRRDAV